MIRRLTYSVTFTNPERTISRDLVFGEGLTAITGPNGEGKSLNLELIQFSLHGAKALRAGVKDYKKLEALLEFSVRNVAYRVERTLKGAKLFEGEDIIASGTSPVNSAILSIFGYSYEVFKVANVAGQGEIEALGNMAPADRKRLVDETIGLNALDELTTYIQGEVRDLSTTVKVLENQMVEPVKPEDPGVQSSTFYTHLLKGIDEWIKKRDVLMDRVNRPLPDKPVVVEPEPDADKREEYIEQNKKHEALLAEVKLLSKELVKLPAGAYVPVELDPEDGELDKYVKLAEERRVLDRKLGVLPPRPKHTIEELKGMEAQWELVKRWKERGALLSDRVSYTCPACNHKWHDENLRLKDYEDLGLPDKEPEIPPLTEQELQLEWYKLSKREEREIVERALYKIEGDPDAVVSRIHAARVAFHQNEVKRLAEERRKEIGTRLTEIEQLLVDIPDRSDCIERLRKNDIALVKYREQLKRYTEAVEARDSALKELAQFPPDLDQQREQYQADYRRAVQYETDLDRYTKALTEYETKKADLEIRKAELRDWENGKKAIVDLRARVKGYLLPSLNAAASYLVNEMTGGVLSWIVVDEDFNISVEGQKLETLSGSGKAVSNLALRIGLGQILCNRVFSTMLLDEVDASMDYDRASYVASCLRNLTKVVRQVVLVSHKPDLVADHHIRMGEASERSMTIKRKGVVNE